MAAGPTRRYGLAERSGIPSRSASQPAREMPGDASSLPDDGARDDGRARAERDADEAAAAEALDAVTVAPGLAGPGAPLREDADQAAVRQDPVGRLRGRADPAQPDREPAHQRQVALAVVEERAEVAAGRVIAPERVAQHQRVPGHQAGVVRDHQRRAGRRHVVDGAHRGPPPGGVEQLDQRRGPLDQPRVHAVAVEPLRWLEQPRQVHGAREPRAERGQEPGHGLAQLVAGAGEVPRGEPAEPVLQPLQRGVEAPLHLGHAGVGGGLEAGGHARLGLGERGRGPSTARRPGGGGTLGTSG